MSLAVDDGLSTNAGDDHPSPTDPLIGPRPAWWWADQEAVARGEMATQGVVGSLAVLNLASCTRAEVLDYFKNGWLLTEVLFSALQGSAAFVRPPYHHLRHPMIFYYGHTACFYINKLRAAGLVQAPINAYFEALFEVGVDEMSWDDMSKNHMEWPRIQQVNEYRKQVFDCVVALIASHPALEPDHTPITRDSDLWALVMAMEHERIHLETSSVLVRELPLGLLQRPAQWPQLHPSLADAVPDGPSASALHTLLPVAGSTVVLGKPGATPYYGWDNEFGARAVQVEPFAVSRCMVTNAQFLAFVQVGGYSNPSYWSAEGWQWRSYRDISCPSFWVASDKAPGGYLLRTTFEEIAMPGLWPVCVSFHEAKAYMAWKSAQDTCNYRLPTEAEHALLRRAQAGAAGVAPYDAVTFHDSAAFASARKHNLNLAFGSESSVLWAEGEGVADVGGNLWDWCEDDFNSLDGFKVHPYYDDFSTPCFDGHHSMILGGSFVSTGAEASIWARFHFRQHFIQQVGFHMVNPSSPHNSAVQLRSNDTSSLKYETQATLNQYLLFHFGSADDALPPKMQQQRLHDFPRRCGEKVAEWARRLDCNMGKAIDVGCAVGAASFELGRAFEHVQGVDISEAFISTARELQQGQSLSYQVMLQGELAEARTANAGRAGEHDHVHFRRADACSLPAEYADFDAVLAANLLCRIPSPKAFLGRLGGPRGLVRPGGVLVLASPYSWSETYTTRSAWMGARMQDGQAIASHDAVKQELGPEFELVHREEMPFMLREHGRKFEYVVSDLTVWRRKPGAQ